MFRTINKDLFEGPCPYCESPSFKFREDDTWMFLCHSCQRYFPFSKLNLSEKDISISPNFNSLLNICQPVSSLPDNHKCRQYCVSRHIPLERVMYIEHFNRFSEYSDIRLRDQPRLVIPFLDEDKNLFGLQGRSLDSDSLRYITIMFDKNKPKVYGLDRVDMSRDHIIVEGPIDSMFVDNCLAMAGSDISYISHKSIICLDNEPFSPVIVKKMKKHLENGYRVVIWPQTIKEKDINDMYLASYDVNTIIRENTYSGLQGLVQLSSWKKI